MKGKKIVVFLTAEFLVIFLCVVVLAGAVWLGFDYGRLDRRDRQRVEMLTQVQVALEAFYQDHGYYPGESRVDENGLWIPADWYFLSHSTALAPYYNFRYFVDPCEPHQPVGHWGEVQCATRLVKYRYGGLACGDGGCQGYRLLVDLENGEERQFSSQAAEEINK